LVFVFVGTTSISAAHPSGTPKQDLEIPPPPMQPMHQSASAAELASKGREAEQQEEEQQQSPAQHQPSSKTEKSQPGVGAASTSKQQQGAKAEIQQGKAQPVREASRLQKESKPEVLLYPLELILLLYILIAGGLIVVTADTG
jgi:cobalamin biosynthesis Mg chelatase CobN